MTPLKKLPKNVVVAKGFKSCPKSNKSPNLVTLPGWESVMKGHETVPQCDQIGLFLKDLGCKFSYKSSPNIRELLRLISEKQNFEVKPDVATFLATCGEQFGHFLLQHLISHLFGDSNSQLLYYETARVTTGPGTTVMHKLLKQSTF